MIERFLIEHCSATLASIKAANLCNMTFSSKEELEDQISYWSACLEPKGIRIFVLREHETRALGYVYREGLLQETGWQSVRKDFHMKSACFSIIRSVM